MGLWIGTEDGIAELGSRRSGPVSGDGWAASLAIVEDHEGTIWVGTNSPGGSGSIRDRNRGALDKTALWAEASSPRTRTVRENSGRLLISVYGAGSLARPNSMTCRSPPSRGLWTETMEHF